ncbi:MAG: U32 family peptidase [Duodenibacillus sp.]|nr:U32 family peptidase [Duodenibacillus sp.]
MTAFAPLELLAPARDVAVGMAAIDHGADAVYIGGPGFGARAAAGNSLADIERLARHARRYRARVYLTLNTLLFDDEIEAAQRLAWQAYEAGVDALILQDMGLLQTDLPPIELHASTQCDVRTPEKAAFLDACGFSQVVLARELTLDEIRACRAAMPRSRIEFFVHGALCVSYSGRCYLSCAECGRSANRGECAQPCRLPYTVLDFTGRELARDKHVLSLKDNDQSANLERLVEAGVTSFKIEGRLKDASYVKNITAYYRRRIDALLEKRACDGWEHASLGRTSFAFEPNPEKTFHRSATDYFVNGRRPMIAQLDTPKSTGETVGTVIGLNRRPPHSIDIRHRVPVANGDGLVYRDSHDELVGLAINRVDVLDDKRLRLFPRESLMRHPDLAVGTTLNRNKDRLFQKELAGDSASRLIPVDFTLHARADALTLVARADRFTAEVTESFVVSAAKNPEAALANLTTNLMKTGETIFSFASLDVAANDESLRAPFVPASLANRLRRDVLERLADVIATTPIERTRLAPTPCSYDVDTLDCRGNVANALARTFWTEHGVVIADQAFELDPDAHRLDALMHCRHCIRHTLKLCPKTVKGDPALKEAFKARNGGHLKPEPLTLIDPKGRRLIARFDCKACEMTVGFAPN